MRIPVLAAVVILGVACGGGDDRDDAGTSTPIECPTQADGTCSPDAPDDCWSWSTSRVRPDAGCIEGNVSFCTSGGVDAGASFTCWQITYPDGGTALYQTADTTHRFPDDWSITYIDDDTCESAEALCDP